MTTPVSLPSDLPAGVVRFPIDGVLVIGNRSMFRHRMLDLFEAGAKEVRIDLTDCSYIDASGLGVLISIAKSARDRFGARIVLEHPNEDLQALFALTKLDTLFRFDA